MVSFKSIKEKVTLKQILEHYDILDHLSERGKSLRGTCPFCESKEGNPFSASLEKNCFNTFCCGKHGNVIDFVADMESLSVIQAAQKLDQLFSLVQRKRKEEAHTVSPKGKKGALQTTKDIEGGEVNPPLTFTLKGIDPSHPSMAELGISEKTAKTFGVGYYDGRGMFTNHIVMPIHSCERKIIGYCGIDPNEPTKLIYPKKFHQENELFGHQGLFDRRKDRNLLVICQHPLQVLLLTQAGYEAAAFMGDQFSEEQVKWLLCCCKPCCNITIFMPQNNERTVAIIARLITIFHIRLVRFTPDTNTPLGFLSETVKDLLEC